MFFLAPSLSRVLDVAERHCSGQASVEEVKASLPEAFAFVNHSAHMLELLQAGILRTEQVDETIDQARLEIAAERRALEEIERTAREGKLHGVADHAGRLRSSAERLLELYGQLQAAEKQERIYSPFAALDHFIKVGINLLNGYLDPYALQARLPTAASVLADLGASIEQFAALYGEQALVTQMGQCLAGLQAGLGAVVGFLEQDDRQALEDGLRLLGSGSTVMSGLLKRCDEHAAAHRRFSRHRALEDFLRALEAHQQGRAPEATARRAWTAVEEVCTSFAREVSSVQNLSLFPELEDEWRPVRRAVDELEAAVRSAAAELSPLPSLEAFAAGPLEEAFEKVASGIESLWQRLDSESLKLRQAPHLEGLRELIGRAVKGEVPGSRLREGLEHYQRLQQDLMEQLARTSASGASQKMMGLLTIHSAAFDGMMEVFEDGDPEHLRRGWSMIEGTLPALLELGEQMQQTVGGRVARQRRTVTCFRCGADNPTDRRMCGACGAVLPAVPQGPAETVDILGGGAEAAGGPANLVRLEAMAGQAEAGLITADQLAAELDAQLSNANKMRQLFEKQLIPMMGTDTALDAYLQFFASALGQYVQGLLQMRSFAEGAGLSHLHSGLSRCREVAGQLEAMRGRIDEAVRSRG